MIVDFTKIHPILPAQATPIRELAMGVTTDETRPTLYDPKWGYFLFGQQIVVEYEDDTAYQSHAIFTIQGVFTRDAEVDVTATDEQAFNALTAKYMALEAMMNNAAKGSAPDQYNLWGTENDPRCVPLPLPLKTSDDQTVYAFPASMSIEKTLFPNEIRYICVLTEAVIPSEKLMINDVMVDNAEVEIVCPSPVLARHQIIGTSGEILQLRHYKAMEMEIQASIPLTGVGEEFGTAAGSINTSMQTGKLSLKLVDRAGAVKTVVDSLDVIDGGMEADYRNQIAQISIQARE